MILAVDIGNTNTAVGGVDETKTYFIGRIITDQGRTDTEHVVSFKNILEMHQINIVDIEGAVLSSVVPPVNSTILSAVEKATENRPLLVGSGMKTGVNIIMDNPRTVDGDQIVDAVAASHEHPLPLMVIDMGTATTLHITDKRGNYIGGIIPPSLRISLSSLSSRMAQLPCINLGAPSHVVGENIVDYMRSGTIYGNVDMIDGILDHMEKELGEPPTIIAAGELAKFVTSLCCHRILVDDALFLKGLSILYQKNMEAH